MELHITKKWRCPQCGSDNTTPRNDYYDGDYFYEVISCGTCGCEWENEYVYVKTVIEEDEDE